jgi:hypothetical protein
MEPVYYVIAILGCADGSTQCTPVTTIPTHYASESACSAATAVELSRNSAFDFPTLVAECRKTDPRTIASKEQREEIPAGAARG